MTGQCIIQPCYLGLSALTRSRLGLPSANLGGYPHVPPGRLPLRNLGRPQWALPSRVVQILARAGETLAGPGPAEAVSQHHTQCGAGRLPAPPLVSTARQPAPCGLGISGPAQLGGTSPDPSRGGAAGS